MRTLNAIKSWIFLGTAILGTASHAYELNVQVLSADKTPVSDAVVYAISDEPVAATGATRMAVMDQHNKMFMPHVLAVPAGTTVDFPNTDTVNHYVYSFSEIKKFQFKLFKTDLEKHQMLFDKPGLVTMGCNIHDFMLGYIFVAPTPYVGVTDEKGKLHLMLPDKGKVTLELWHERNNEDLNKLTQEFLISSGVHDLQIQFKKPLKSPRKMSHDGDNY